MAPRLCEDATQPGPKPEAQRVSCRTCQVFCGSAVFALLGADLWGSSLGPINPQTCIVPRESEIETCGGQRQCQKPFVYFAPDYMQSRSLHRHMRLTLVQARTLRSAGAQAAIWLSVDKQAQRIRLHHSLTWPQFPALMQTDWLSFSCNHIRICQAFHSIGRRSRKWRTTSRPSNRAMAAALSDNSIAVTAYALDATKVTACITKNGMMLVPRMVAHMAGVGGVRCRTSAIGAR